MHRAKPRRHVVADRLREVLHSMRRARGRAPVTVGASNLVMAIVNEELVHGGRLIVMRGGFQRGSRRQRNRLAENKR